MLCFSVILLSLIALVIILLVTGEKLQHISRDNLKDAYCDSENSCVTKDHVVHIFSDLTQLQQINGMRIQSYENQSECILIDVNPTSISSYDTDKLLFGPEVALGPNGPWARNRPQLAFFFHRGGCCWAFFFTILGKDGKH
jgi:hypothetical protein